MSRFFSVIVCFVALKCFAGSTNAETPVPLEALRDAPQLIRVDGVVVHLKAEVWRDFMPGLLSDTNTYLVTRGSRGCRDHSKWTEVATPGSGGYRRENRGWQWSHLPVGVPRSKDPSREVIREKSNGRFGSRPCENR